jgi:hypothetical protein
MVSTSYEFLYIKYVNFRNCHTLRFETAPSSLLEIEKY